jgi:hypothetical protein
MSIVEFIVGSDRQSIWRHYNRKIKDDLVRAVQDLQRRTNSDVEPACLLTELTKDTLATKAMILHQKLPE